MLWDFLIIGLFYQSMHEFGNKTRHCSDVRIPSLAYTFVVSHIGSVHRIKKVSCIHQKVNLLGSYQVVCLMP